MEIDKATRDYAPYRFTVAESRVYPTLAAGAAVVSAAVNWTYGAYAQIVPAGAITEAFDITHISVEACNDNAVFQLQLYKGAGNDLVCTIRFAVAGGFFGNQLYFVTSERVEASERIQARLASSNGGAVQATIAISIGYYQEGL